MNCEPWSVFKMSGFCRDAPTRHLQCLDAAGVRSGLPCVAGCPGYVDPLAATLRLAVPSALLRLFASIGMSSSSERQYLEAAAARRSVLQKGSRGHEDNDRPRRPARARGPRRARGSLSGRTACSLAERNRRTCTGLFPHKHHRRKIIRRDAHGRTPPILGVRPTPRNRTSRIPRVMRGRRTNQLARRPTPKRPDQKEDEEDLMEN